jgi:hypothetical protein
MNVNDPKQLARDVAEYCYSVHSEIVYNEIFARLPIYPYNLRRKVARKISDKLNPCNPAWGWWKQ